MILKTLGKNLKKYRLERGLTQQALADRSQISLVFLQSIEAGKRWVSHETVAQIARALGVSETALFAEPCEAPLQKTQPDPRVVLELICTSFGIELPKDALAKARIRPYRQIIRTLAGQGDSGHIDLSHMPEELFYDLITLCQDPDCQWDRFREALRSLSRRAG